MSTVRIAELESFFGQIFDELKRRVGNEVEVDSVNYWAVSLGDAFERQAPAVGMLSLGLTDDDVSEVMQRDEDEMLLLEHDAVHAVSLLRYLLWRSGKASGGSTSDSRGRRQ